jgi:hypothetical protein
MLQIEFAEGETIMKRSLASTFAIAVTIAILTMGQPLYAGKPQIGRATAAQVQAVACCVVTAIDSHTSIVTAKVNATGIRFEFQVTDPRLMAQIHLGTPVYANFKAQQVSLDGSTMCCRIIGIEKPVQPAPPAATASAPPTAATTPADPTKLAMSATATGRVAASLEISQKNHPPANYGPVIPAVGCPAQSGSIDLVVTALGFNPARHVVYTIANCGRTVTNLPFVVDLFMNNQRVDTIEQKVLPGASQQTVTSELAVDQGCNEATLLAVADPQNVVSESSGRDHQKTVQISPPCPNLAVTNIKQVWEDMNTRYEVQFTIQNQGNGPPPIPITVTESVAYDDGVLIPYGNEYPMDPLLPGQSVTFHDSKKHLMTETIDVEVIIDMQHQINVSNPNNNISKKTLGPH